MLKNNMKHKKYTVPDGSYRPLGSQGVITKISSSPSESEKK
jgi:hypothetical protein